MLRPKLVFTRLGCSAQLWERGVACRVPNTVLTLWWPTRRRKRPSLKLYFWRGRNRYRSRHSYQRLTPDP